MAEHERRSDCEVELRELQTFKSEATNPTTGKYVCQDRKIYERVKLKTFLYILFFTIGALGILIGITYSVATESEKEHKNLATKAEVIALDTKVDEIKNKQIEIDTTLKSMDKTQTEVSETLKAILQKVK